MNNTTQPLRNHTISSIGDAQGYKKRAAQGWLAKAREKYGELGEIIDGTRFYSDDERAKILEFASERRVASEPVQPTQAEESEAVQGEIEIYDSRAIQTLPQPEFSSSIDLGGFSSNTFEAQSYSDPMAFVDQVRQSHNQIIAAMRQNVADGQQILNATTHAVLEMDEESRRIADAAEQYRIEKAVQSALLNQQQQALQQKVQQQQSLGKPPSGSQQPQS